MIFDIVVTLLVFLGLVLLGVVLHKKAVAGVEVVKTDAIKEETKVETALKTDAEKAESELPKV